MAGAGKSEVCDYLSSTHGFARVYFGQVVLDEVVASGMAPGPESERSVRERLRDEEGMAVMASRSLPRIRSAREQSRQVCIDGLYSGDEWRLLSDEVGLVVIAVHCPRWLRKSRLERRPVRSLSGAELDQRDLSEVKRLDKATPIALADAHLINDRDLVSLHDRVDSLVDQLPAIADARLQRP